MGTTRTQQCFLGRVSIFSLSAFQQENEECKILCNILAPLPCTYFLQGGSEDKKWETMTEKRGKGDRGGGGDGKEGESSA